MNAKLKPFNSPRVMITAAVVSFAALGLISNSIEAETQPTFSHAQPSEYGVQSLKLTSQTSGISIINLDGFRIKVSFDFEAHPDSYGVPGSDFTAVEITNLSIDKVSDANGNAYSDFTDYNDHRNINLLLSAFIEKNNLAEAV